MPIVHSVVSESNDHVYLPVITQMAHSLVNTLNLKQYIQENIHIETGWTTTKGTRDNHKFRVRDHMFKVNATMQPYHTPAFEHQTFPFAGGHGIYPHMLDNAYIPILKDPVSRISLHEVPMPCSFNLECQFWTNDRNLAYDFNKRLNLRYFTGIAHTCSMIYDYPVPKDIISALFALYKYRKFDERDKVFGKQEVSFATWLDRLSITDFVLATSRNGKRKELVINKSLDNIIYTVDHDGSQPSEDKSNTAPTGYSVNFSCKIQFTEVIALILKYPCMIDNTLLPETMIPIHRNHDTPIRSMVPRYGNPVMDAAYRALSGNPITHDAIKCPFYDDWVVPESNLARRSYRPFFICLYSVEEGKDTTSIDLNGTLYEDSQLHEVVKYILKEQGTESFKDDVIFNISSYIDDRPQISKELMLDPDLKLYIRAGNIHPNRHLVISEISNYAFLNPKWKYLLDKFKDYFDVGRQPGGYNYTHGDNNNATHRAFRIFKYGLIPRNTGIRK